MDLTVGVVTDQYPSDSHPDRGTFVQDLVRNLRSADVTVELIHSARNFAKMALECSVKSAKVDIFDAQFVAPSGFITSLTSRLCPFVVTVHRWDILEFPHRFPLATLATRFTLNTARGIVAVGQHILNETRKYVKDASKLTMIPNAVDTERFHPGIPMVGLKRQLGIPEKNLVILSVGHLIPRKGFQFLVKAFHSVLRQYRHCSLVIAGGGPMYSEIAVQARLLGISGSISLLGIVSDHILPSVYAMADIFVMPSLSEGHCVSILEAMSTGKPVIASAIEANAESVVQGVNGFLVPPGDPLALRNAILRLCLDPQTRRKFGYESRQQAIRRFAWSVRARRLVRFYESSL